MKRQGNINRRKRVEKVWKKIYKAYYKDHLAIKDILDKYRNPKNGKKYSRTHLYTILDTVENSKGKNEKG